jgi:hypothetical protein
VVNSKIGTSSIDYVSVSILIKLYDVIVKPIATYGSEIWGTELLISYQNIAQKWTRDPFNIVTIKVANSIAQLPKRACNWAAIAEIDWTVSNVH